MFLFIDKKQMGFSNWKAFTSWFMFLNSELSAQINYVFTQFWHFILLKQSNWMKEMILYNLFEKKMPGALISLKQILQSENSLTISSAVHEFCQNTTTSRNFTLISLLKTTGEIIIPINKIRPWKSYGNNWNKLEPMSFLSMRVTKNS